MVNKIIDLIKSIWNFFLGKKDRKYLDENDEANSSDSEYYSENNNLPATKDDLKELNPNYQEVERLNPPEEEIKEEEYRIIGFAKSVGKWTKKILDEKKEQIYYQNPNDSKYGKGIIGKWTAFVSMTYNPNKNKQSWQDQVDNSRDSNNKGSSKNTMER